MRVKDRVENILKDSYQCRDSDKKLLINFWFSEGLELSRNQIEKFLNCTPAESITRARRLLKIKYPCSPAVDQARFERFKEYRNGGADYL